ncbi:MAG: hypothetical protein ACXVH4_02920, partial [Halobacteriota archaeon]
LFFINLYWKISIHTMGIAGPTTVLVFAFGYWGALLGLLLPPVIWSNVPLEKHTVVQPIVGAILGFVLTAIALSFALLLAPINALVCGHSQGSFGVKRRIQTEARVTRRFTAERCLWSS